MAMRLARAKRGRASGDRVTLRSWGAIDMARAELQYGDDPWVKQLAQGIIAAQEKEIAEMKDWLGKQPQ